jgi:hypothetical protein
MRLAQWATIQFVHLKEIQGRRRSPGSPRSHFVSALTRVRPRITQMGSRLLGAVAWLCLTIAGISIAMLLLALLLQRVPASAFTDVAALGLVAAVLALIGFALLRRVQVGRTESPRMRLSATQWLPLALLMGFTFGALTVGYSLQVHVPVTQALGGGLLSAIVVFAASSLGFSRRLNAFF